MTTEAIESVVAPASSLLPGLVQRPPELGRIRMGEKSERGLPVRLKTFRLTSASKATLEAAASLYGGTVREWKDAPDEGMFELVTAAAELDVLIPASLAVIGQSYEFWQGGTLERRCDGTTEQISASPCLCAAAGLTGGDRVCDIVTRLRVMLPRVPGLGVWRLDTSGYVAATTLPSTITLLARLTPGQWIPAVLRAEQRSKKERLENGKVQTHRFVVPVLDLPGTTIGQIVGTSQTDAALLEDGERPRPPTAAERAAQKRAELEAQQGGSVAAPAAAPAGLCASPSPKNEPCALAAGHSGDHRAGNKSWPATKQAVMPAGAAATERPVASDGEPGQEEGAAADRASAAAPDLTAAAREVFEGDFRDEVPADVQAGLALLPPEHQKGGR